MMYFILPILVAVSWLAIFLSEKRNIYAQWLLPVRQRIKEFSLGLVSAAVLCTITQFTLAWIWKTSLTVAEGISSHKVLFSLFYDANSVLAEEHLFRGVLLLFLITKLGARRGVLISAIAFGIYHWFTFGVLGNWTAMMLVLLTTGLMGFVFATAYERTQSLVLPVGIHLGWNWINNTVFSNGPNGTVILQQAGSAVFGIIPIVIYIAVPLVLLAFINLLARRKSHP